MANDRLYLIHPPTGERVLLAKHFQDWHTMPQQDLEDRISDFFEKVGYTLGCGFQLETEHTHTVTATMETNQMTDQEHASKISHAIYNLNFAIQQAKEAKLRVHLTADEFDGQTLTSLVSREYEFDVTKGDYSNE